MSIRPLALPACALISAGAVIAAFADGPADNLAENVRPVPPPGVAVPDADRAELEAGLKELSASIERLRADRKAAPLLPDVQIYHNAVRYALQYGEFFKPAEVQRAKEFLKQGQERAAQLARGEAPWLTQTGPTARGYVSRIDGSVQPYGLYVPPTYKPGSGKRWRLDTWFHGRGETLSEVNFIDGVQKSGGPFVRPDTFVLQPYGRYCNANKLAGEVDLFEALDDIKRQFPIDEDRIVVRGFSMGGAACWQFAAHYASLWAAAAPGAGFSETPEFLNVFQNEKVQPTWWEKKLWQMYDCPEYAPNFHNLPTVAYSGEIDRQKQAADVMEAALKAEGIPLPHIIGPNTGHSYHPTAAIRINTLIDRAAAEGRNRVPTRVRLATPTLKYNRQYWVTVDALKKHWEPARVDAEIQNARSLSVKTQNIAALTLELPAGENPLTSATRPTLTVDGQSLTGPQVKDSQPWQVRLTRQDDRWAVAGREAEGLRKRHDLQGPIDDAFMGSFLMVRPTGTPAAPGIAKWVDAEMNHAVREWRRQFRGDARVKADAEVSAADIAQHNLVLWGDPGSNKLLARIADRLPIRWQGDAVVVGGKRYPAATHAPVFIFPNPLNPDRYVVLNSGFTYREYDYLNNARQVPKLPDWAIVDTTNPPNSRYPGKVVDASFFGERWELTEGQQP